MSDSKQSPQPASNNESSNRNSSWKLVYLILHRENDLERLTQAVMAAETAIFERMQELSGQPDHSEEHAEIQAANEELLRIKVQKLGWPNPSM